jgi:hypothetical protein
VLLVQVAFAAAIECGLTGVRDPFYAGKAARLHARLRRAGCTPTIRSSHRHLTLTLPARTAERVPAFTIMMLGTSRAAYGLKAGELEAQLAGELDRPLVVFNFGIPAAGPFSQLLSLHRLLEEGIRPSLLLLEVLPPLLQAQDPVPAEARWLPARRLRLSEIALLEQLDFPTAELRCDWWRGLLAPWHTHRFALVSRLAPAWLPWSLREEWADGQDDCGWTEPIGPAKTPEGRRRDLEIARLQYAAMFAGYKLGGPSARAQQELLEVCRREGIPAALVLMPEGSLFRSWYPPGAWDQVESFLQRLRREYGIPIINAREWMDDDDFSDSHHLTVHGASRFTERLGREALRPLLHSLATGGQP